MMFISHCPDPDLTVSFKFKPAEKWSAEVQEQLDSHMIMVKTTKATSNDSLAFSAHKQNVQFSQHHT